jgi:hypothetical protein
MSYLTVGFTGTREGMSLRQRDLLREILQRTPPHTFHHGAAIGADHEAVSIVEAWCPKTTIVAHRAGTNPLTRNRAIVAAVELLIAAPRSNTEELRSGTWATVRYAKKAGKPVVVLGR